MDYMEPLSLSLSLYLYLSTRCAILAVLLQSYGWMTLKI